MSTIGTSYRLISEKEYQRHQKREIARRRRKFICACQWASLILLLVGIIGGCYATYSIMFAGASMGKDFDSCMLHAAMEMILCVTPGIAACMSSADMR